MKKLFYLFLMVWAIMWLRAASGVGEPERYMWSYDGVQHTLVLGRK